MRFSTYLIENNNLKTEATLVLHKIISMVDHGHVDVSDNDYRFSVGPMVHKGSYNGLRVVIRKANSENVRFGKDGSGNPVIVVDVAELPERKKIDTLLSSKNVFGRFIEAFVTYLQTSHNSSTDTPKHESELELANNSNFEDNYNKLISEFKENNIKAYEAAVEEVKAQTSNIANPLKLEAGKLSLRNLQKEYIGSTMSEFLAIVKKLPSFRNLEKLQKELSEKLDSRLKAYYASSIQPLSSE